MSMKWKGFGYIRKSFGSQKTHSCSSIIYTSSTQISNYSPSSLDKKDQEIKFSNIAIRKMSSSFKNFPIHINELEEKTKIESKNLQIKKNEQEVIEIKEIENEPEVLNTPEKNNNKDQKKDELDQVEELDDQEVEELDDQEVEELEKGEEVEEMYHEEELDNNENEKVDGGVDEINFEEQQYTTEIEMQEYYENTGERNETTRKLKRQLGEYCFPPSNGSSVPSEKGNDDDPEEEEKGKAKIKIFFLVVKEKILDWNEKLKKELSKASCICYL